MVTFENSLLHSYPACPAYLSESSDRIEVEPVGRADGALLYRLP